MSPLLREFAVLSIGRLAKGKPDFPLSSYITGHPSLIGESLAQPFLSTYSFETLQEIESVLDAMKNTAPNSIPGGLENCLVNVRHRIEEIEARLKRPVPADAPYAQKEELSDEWQVSSSTGPVWGAMVIGYPSKDPVIKIGKALEFRLGLELSGEWGRRHKREVVEFDGRTLLKKDDFEQQLYAAVRYAEMHFVDTYGVREIPGLNRRYQFTAQIGSQRYDSDPFTGGSAGLALSILSMAAIDGLRVRNKQRYLYPGTALTGQIDTEGNIKSVADSEMHDKTVSVFRSPCFRFIVPKDNCSTVQQTLEKLRSEHPERDLEIIPAANVREVFENDEITSEKTVSAPSIAISRARRKRKTVLAAVSTTVAVIALVIVSVFTMIFSSKSISSAKFDGDRIKLVNRFNHSYKEVVLPYHVNVKSDNNYMDTTGKSHRLIIEDITGDGNKELLFIGVAANSGAADYFGTIHLHLYDEKGGELRHITAFDSIEVAMGSERRAVRDVSYRKDVVADLDGDGFKEVVIYFVERSWAPSGVIVFSLKDESSETFIHYGNLQQLIVGDFDADGTKDIVASAECNYASTSVLIVLDPNFIRGSSPPLKGLEFIGYDRNVAQYLIFMPRSVVFKNQSYVQRPSINNVQINTEKHIQIGVCEEKMEDTCAALVYEFGSDWSCISAFGTDPYRFAFNRLQESGLEELRHIKYEEYVSSLKNEFRYLDWDTLTTKPVVNSAYKALMNK